MTQAPSIRDFDAQGSSSQISDGADQPTVASLGVRARLAPIDQDRERDLAQLIASCEILRKECERLFGQMIELLNKDGWRN